MHRQVLGFMVGVVTTCLVGWALQHEPAPEAPPARPAPAYRPVTAPARVVPPPRGPVVQVEAIEPLERGSFERVVRKIAEYAGEGIVRCDVGDKLPDGPVIGIGRAWVENGVLIGSVEDPEGQARIQLPDDEMSDAPRLVVKWSEAWPGDTGSCLVVQPKRVLVTGQLLDSAGRVVSEGEVGNLVDGTHPVTADGKFAALCWQGAECPLAGRRSVGEAFGAFVTVVPDRPLSGIVVVLEGPQPEKIEDYLEQRVAEDERLSKQPDPLVLALADPELPAETRPVVERWLEEEREGRSMTRALLAEVAAR